MPRKPAHPSRGGRTDLRAAPTAKPRAASPAIFDGVISTVTWAVIAAFALMLAWMVIANHPVGDYFTESDFYGGYAEGARLFQRGVVDFSRFPVVGPVFDLALAVFGLFTRDLFPVAKWISLVSTVTLVVVWVAIVRRRIGAGAGLSVAALLAANPVLFRYGYSATTDALSAGLNAACIGALLLGAGWRVAALAGLLAALATFTRYSNLVLFPAGVLLILLAPLPGVSKGRSLAGFLATFLIPVLIWSGLSLAHGHLPGARLVSDAEFYSNRSALSRNVQDAPTTPPAGESPAAGTREPRPPLSWILNFGEHLSRDARELLGWPVALLAALGVALAALDRRWRVLLPIVLPGALLFLALTPVFYSDRYMLPAIPVYMTLAAVGVACTAARIRVVPVRVVVASALTLAAVVFTAQRSIALQRLVRTQLPVEVLELGGRLRAELPAESRIVSRKPHIAYYADRPSVPFARVPTLAELSDQCRAARADALYFSWYEGELRPEFWHLLDTTGVVPGLTPIVATAHNPAVVYRIGPEFGAEPTWFASDSLRRVHTARAQVQVLPEAMVWRERLFLAAWDAEHGDVASAIRHLELVVQTKPELTNVRAALDRLRRSTSRRPPGIMPARP